jgi:hypothetical protein
MAITSAEAIVRHTPAHQMALAVGDCAMTENSFGYKIKGRREWTMIPSGSTATMNGPRGIADCRRKQRMQSGNRGQMKYLIAAGMAVALIVATTGVSLDRPFAKKQIRPITLEQVHCAVYWDC